MPDSLRELSEIRRLLLDFAIRVEMLRLVDRLSDLYESPTERKNLYPVAAALATSVAAHSDYLLSEILPALSRLEDLIAHD